MLLEALQKQFEEAGLGVAVKFRFPYPHVAFGKDGPFSGFPEMEVGQDRPVGELMLESFHDGFRPGGDFVGEQRFPEPLPDVAGPAPADGGLPSEASLNGNVTMELLEY